MGRGDRSTVRWRNERIRAKKARDKRKAAQKGGVEAPPSQAPARPATR